MNCGSCGAQIFFAPTENNRRMPIDAEPAADGTLVLVSGQVDAREKVVEFYDAQKHQGLERWRPHWSTCDKPNEWRRIGARAAQKALGEE